MEMMNKTKREAIKFAKRMSCFFDRTFGMGVEKTKRLEKEKIKLGDNLYALDIEGKLWLLEEQNAPFYLAEKCLRCGKRKPIIKQSGYCLPCHLRYSQELVPCPVYTQLAELTADMKESVISVMEMKCSSLKKIVSYDKFGAFLIPPNATKCPHCHTRLICPKCGHKLPLHQNSCYRCDDRRTLKQKLELLNLTETEIDALISVLPIPLERDEFVSEALLPLLPHKIEFETLLYLLSKKLPKEKPTSTLSLYCAIKGALEQEPLSPLLVDFYRGSGWLPKAPTPVRIEPPFTPISESEILPLTFESEVSKFNLLSYRRDLKKMRCFNLVISGDITPRMAETFWSSLTTIVHPVSFEILGCGCKQKVVFQLICQQEDKDYISTLLSSAFPTAPINLNGTDDDYLQFGRSFSCLSVSLGLGYHWGNLIRRFTSFSVEPLTELVSILGALGKNEGAIVQAIIMPAKEPWEKTIERLSCLKDKIKYPLFAVSLKVMVYAQDKDRLQSLLTDISRALHFQAPQGNCLSATPLSTGDGLENYLTQEEIVAVVERNSYRFGFLLNSQELASICHLPSKSLTHPRLLRATPQREAPPFAANPLMGGVAIGINEVSGREKPVYLPSDFRPRHVYIVGKTGTGKTTLLLNMIKGDIDAGKGVGLIDPHGDLLEMVLKVVPENRRSDVIYFNPADDQPIGLNLLEVESPKDKRQVKNDLLSIIKRFYGSSLSLNSEQLLRLAIATLLEDNSRVYTLPDLRKLFTDENFRTLVLNHVKDEYLLEFWEDDFPAFHPASIAAAKRRLDDIISEPTVRKILNNTTNTTLNLKNIMSGKKIFLANLSKGIIGEDVSRLLGGLLVSKIQLTATARASQTEKDRQPFYFYVDEFQNFINDSFEVILSEARKYNICLTIAHQFTGQLTKRLYDAVFGNVGTLIVFEVGIDDAKALEKQLSFFTTDDIINLSRFHTFTRIGKAIDTFSMRTLPPPGKGGKRENEKTGKRDLG